MPSKLNSSQPSITQFAKKGKDPGKSGAGTVTPTKLPPPGNAPTSFKNPSTNQTSFT